MAVTPLYPSFFLILGGFSHFLVFGVGAVADFRQRLNTYHIVSSHSLTSLLVVAVAIDFRHCVLLLHTFAFTYVLLRCFPLTDHRTKLTVKRHRPVLG